jgi:hypothetical protein
MNQAKAKAETFEDVRRTLWSLAWKFVHRHGFKFGDVNDVYGELALVFEKVYREWDPERRTDFNTFLTYKCVRRLQDIERGRGPNGEVWRDGPNASFAQERWNVLCDNEWEPEEKQNAFMARLVLDTPIGLARIIDEEENTRFAFRTTIRGYLYGRGWSFDRVSEAYEELEESLE